MNLHDLANLVAVRNHITHLVNTERHLVPKEMVKTLDAAKTKLDKLFLEVVVKTNFGFTPEVSHAVVINDTGLTVNSNTGITVSSNNVADLKKNAKLSNGIVTVGPDQDEEDKQLELNFDKTIEPINVDTKSVKPVATPKKKQAKKEMSDEEKAELAEIQDKVNKAKAQVKDKKNGGFKRTGEFNDSELD